MTEWIKANKMYLLIGVLIVAALGIYYFIPSDNENSNEVETQWEETDSTTLLKDQNSETSSVSEETKEEVLVDVKGAVLKPGVYEAKSGDRVIDIINLAGGLLETSDKNQINFAMKVSDEMVLYIPVIGEQSQTTTGTVPAEGSLSVVSPDNGKVNLNTASESELQTLPGIGPAKALAIIEYRETNGQFKKIEDLMGISGIGEKTFEKLKDSIMVK